MDPFLRKFFPSVYHKMHEDSVTNQYCTFDSPTLTLFTSSLYLAALVASFFASWVTREWGRKITMFWGGVIFLAGSAINGAAMDVAMLIIGRLMLGVGVGFANQVCFDFIMHDEGSPFFNSFLYSEFSFLGFNFYLVFGHNMHNMLDFGSWFEL